MELDGEFPSRMAHSVLFAVAFANWQIFHWFIRWLVFKNGWESAFESIGGNQFIERSDSSSDWSDQEPVNCVRALGYWGDSTGFFHRRMKLFISGD